LVFGKILSDCPLNWKHPDHTGQAVVQAAVDCNFFPLYEVEKGITTLNYDPEAKGKKVPAADWLTLMGKTKHLLKPKFESVLKEFEIEVERRWKRIKAMSENPNL
jgi:pyruvate ferredoxin oxidoreductase alpha subunit